MINFLILGKNFILSWWELLLLLQGQAGKLLCTDALNLLSTSPGGLWTVQMAVKWDLATRASIQRCVGAFSFCRAQGAANTPLILMTFLRASWLPVGLFLVIWTSCCRPSTIGDGCAARVNTWYWVGICWLREIPGTLWASNWASKIDLRSASEIQNHLDMWILKVANFEQLNQRPFVILFCKWAVHSGSTPNR